MCERWDLFRGFPQKVQDTKELRKIIRLHRDLIAKRPYLLPPSWFAQETHGGLLAFWSPAVGAA
jgi:hypothetical protein